MSGQAVKGTFKHEKGCMGLVEGETLWTDGTRAVGRWKYFSEMDANYVAFFFFELSNEPVGPTKFELSATLNSLRKDLYTSKMEE